MSCVPLCGFSYLQLAILNHVLQTFRKASHSVLADIKPIQQEDTRGSSGYGSKIKEAEITLDDEWDIIGGTKDQDSDRYAACQIWKEDNRKTLSLGPLIGRVARKTTTMVSCLKVDTMSK